MCEHLQPITNFLKDEGVPITYRGQPWTKNCREWVYYDCVLKVDELKAEFGLDSCVVVHDYNDVKVGAELGLFCEECKDAVVGIYPTSDAAKGKIRIPQ